MAITIASGVTTRLKDVVDANISVEVFGGMNIIKILAGRITVNGTLQITPKDVVIFKNAVLDRGITIASGGKLEITGEYNNTVSKIYSPLPMIRCDRSSTAGTYSETYSFLDVLSGGTLDILGVSFSTNKQTLAFRAGSIIRIKKCHWESQVTTQLRMASSDVQIEDFVLQNIAFTGKATFADNNSYIKNLVADNIQGSSGATNGQFLKIVSPIGKFAQTRGPNLFKILKDGLTLDLISFGGGIIAFFGELDITITDSAGNDLQFALYIPDTNHGRRQDSYGHTFTTDRSLLGSYTGNTGVIEVLCMVATGSDSNLGSGITMPNSYLDYRGKDNDDRTYPFEATIRKVGYVPLKVAVNLNSSETVKVNRVLAVDKNYSNTGTITLIANLDQLYDKIQEYFVTHMNLPQSASIINEIVTPFADWKLKLDKTATDLINIDLPNKLITVKSERLSTGLKLKGLAMTGTGVVYVASDEVFDCPVTDSNGDSYVNLVLPTGFTTATTHATQANAEAGTNTLYSGLRFRYVSTVRAGQTLWVRVRGGDGTIVTKILIPTDAGDHTFSILVSEIGTALQSIQSDITAIDRVVQATSATTLATRNELDGILIEADDGTGKAFTAESLENAPAGGSSGGGLTVTQSQTLSRIDKNTENPLALNVTGFDTAVDGEFLLVSDSSSLTFTGNYNPAGTTSDIDITKPVFKRGDYYLWSRVGSGYHLSKTLDTSKWWWESVITLPASNPYSELIWNLASGNAPQAFNVVSDAKVSTFGSTATGDSSGSSSSGSTSFLTPSV
jgi:hypothetical protein